MTATDTVRPRVAAPWSARHALWVGLALTVLGMAYLAADQLVWHTFADHLRASYAGHVPAAQNTGGTAFLAGVLYANGALGVIGWLWVIRGARRGAAWVRPVAIGLLVLASAMAFLVATVSEYGHTIFPVSLMVTTALPCVAGVVAVVLLIRGRTS